MLFVDSKPIAFSTDAKLSIKTKTRDASSKDSGSWTDKRATRHDWNVSSSALFSDLITTVGTAVNTFDELFDMQVAKTPITVVFAVATGAVHAQTADATKKTYTGSAIITGLDPNAPDGDNASFSITMDGTGALTKA